MLRVHGGRNEERSRRSCPIQGELVTLGRKQASAAQMPTFTASNKPFGTGRVSPFEWVGRPFVGKANLSKDDHQVSGSAKINLVRPASAWPRDGNVSACVCMACEVRLAQPRLNMRSVDQRGTSSDRVAWMLHQKVRALLRLQ